MSKSVMIASCWTALLVALCVMPGRWLRHGEELGPDQHKIPHADKVVHGGLFAVFAVLWSRAGRAPGRFRWILASGIALAVLTELAQGIPGIGRDPDVYDALADITGLLVGIRIFRSWDARSVRRETVEAHAS